MKLLETIDNLLREAVPHEPRKMLPYVRMQARRLRDIKEGAKRAYKTLDRNWGAIDSALRELDQTHGVFQIEASTLDNILSTVSSTSSLGTLQGLIERLGDVEDAWEQDIKGGVKKIAVESAKDNADEILDNLQKRSYRRELAKLPRKRTWANDVKEHLPRREAERVIKVVSAAQEAYSKTRGIAEDISSKLGEKLRRKKNVMKGGDIPPETEDIETLYHASVNAREIYRKGFSEKPKNVMGIGGSQGNLISFTSDLYIAKEIARALKEVAMIARGKVRLKDIVEWAKKDGVWKGKVQKEYKTYVRAAKRSKFGSFQAEDPDITPEDVAREINQPEKVFELYRYYLAVSDRYNPVWLVGGGVEGYLRRLRKVNPRNIGVVVARVNMAKSQEWRRVEREFRVPPEAVLEITDLIR